jgi:hypothetical protein
MKRVSARTRVTVLAAAALCISARPQDNTPKGELSPKLYEQIKGNKTQAPETVLQDILKQVNALSARNAALTHELSSMEQHLSDLERHVYSLGPGDDKEVAQRLTSLEDTRAQQAKSAGEAEAASQRRFDQLLGWLRGALVPIFAVFINEIWKRVKDRPKEAKRDKAVDGKLQEIDAKVADLAVITNGKVDALLRVTGESEHAKGMLAGEKQQKDYYNRP